MVYALGKFFWRLYSGTYYIVEPPMQILGRGCSYSLKTTRFVRYDFINISDDAIGSELAFMINRRFDIMKSLDMSFYR